MPIMKWNREDLHKEFNQFGDLGSVISELENRAWDKGGVICEVWVNGLFLDENEETKFSDTKMNEIESLEVMVRSPDGLVKDSLQSIKEWIPKVKSISLEVSELFREGNHEKAHGLFRDTLDGCLWLTDALRLLKGVLLQTEDESQTQTRIRWTACEGRFSQVVGELLEGYKNRDFVLVADVLEYDLTTVLEEWFEMLNQGGFFKDKIGGEL